MDINNNTWKIKTLLAISGTAFLFLILSTSRTAIYGCIITMLLWYIFLFRSSITSETVKSLINPVYAVSGLLFCIVLGNNFYNIWVTSEKIQALSDFIGYEPKTVGLICTIIEIIVSTPIVAICLSFFVSTFIADFKNIKHKDTCTSNQSKSIPMKKAFLIMTAVYTLGISAILRANFNYLDDMGRVAGGYKGWTNFSRFLTEALSSFIHMDNYLTDVSPLPQLIAVLLLALSGILILYIVYERTDFSVWELIALIPLGLNPYFLECISYKYDAPYIALSILSSVIPLLYKKKNAITYIAISIIGTVAVCTTYQAASGIYPMLVILLMLRMWNNNDSLKKIGNFCLQSIIGYELGIIFFHITIMIPVKTYVSNSLIGMKDLIPGIFNHLKIYYSYVTGDFKTFWLVLIIVMVIGFIWSTACSTKQHIYLSIPIALSALLFMGLLCFGMYPALSAPLFAPRAMYGFGVFITFLGITIMERQKNLPFKTIASILSWTFFVFSFTYGNALYSQKEYTDFRINLLIQDLNDMEIFSSNQPVTVQISGTIGQAPVIKNMPQNYQMLNRLVPSTFQGKWAWGEAGFYRYYNLKNVIADSSVDLTTYNLPVLEEKMYHTIKGQDNYILVELK